MRSFPLRLEKKLNSRKLQNSFRELSLETNLVDFSSNDYLGFASSEKILLRSQEIIKKSRVLKNGATGSRLISGNHDLYENAEALVRDYHQSEEALIFNSGYDANVGFFSSVPGRGDMIFYDELIHASIRDGISMSHAKAFKFKHNNFQDLQVQIERIWKRYSPNEVYIVTEAVFSMDGDAPDLKALAAYAAEKGFFLVVDEAHAVGVIGRKGEGLVQELGIQNQVFARIATFGKALGVHGAAVLGSRKLKDYLVNYSRSLIYTTALPPHSVAAIIAAYESLEGKFSGKHVENTISAVEQLRQNIQFFKSKLLQNHLETFIESNSAIHCCIIPGNEEVKELSTRFEEKGFDVKAILSPTVPKGKERLRFCLHSYNSRDQISEIIKLLVKFAVRF